MVLAKSPTKRELNHLMRWRDRNNARHSLDQIVRQHNNNVNDTNTDYIPYGMTAAEWKAHKDSVKDFNKWYNHNRGIEGIFEKIVNSVKRPILMAGASAYMILNLIACNGNAMPYPSPTSRPTATSIPATATPTPNNSYDFAKSLGLDADYLKEVRYNNNEKEFIRYLSTMPVQIRNIAELSGLIKKIDDKQTASGIVDDGRITLDELDYFKRVMDSYKKEIETLKPWLVQLPENEVTAALALNLNNFMEAGYLKNERMISLLSSAIFFADGIKRMYEDEILDPEAFKTGAINAYLNAAVKNITNFPEIQKKAWEVANSPNAKYSGHSIEHLLNQESFELDAVGSTDKGLNAYLDMKLLWEQGSFEAKAALRIYARNSTREGRQGSAEQVRVPLTMIDAWSLGIDSIGVVLAGHDVPTIPITDEDIALLKGRSADPLLILDIDGGKHMPLQWTRKSAVRSDVTTLTQIYIDRVGGIEYNIADLKPY